MKQARGFPLGLVALMLPCAALAQEPQETPEAETAPADGRLVIDILAPPDAGAGDPLAAEQCEEEADVARVQGEIVVCRSLGQATDGSWNKRDFERRYAEATQGAKTPDVDGSGIRLPTEGSLIAITVTIPFGKVPPPVLMIDVEALPEAPAGSDADRISRGLAPRGEAYDDPLGEITLEQLGLPEAPAG